MLRTSKHDAWYFIWIRMKFVKLSLKSLSFWLSNCSDIVAISFSIFDICIFDTMTSFSFFKRRLKSNCLRFDSSRSRSAIWFLISSLAFRQICWYCVKSCRTFSSIRWTSSDWWSARNVKPLATFFNASSVDLLYCSQSDIVFTTFASSSVLSRTLKIFYDC